MTTMSHAHSAPHLAATHAIGAFGRNLVIGLIAFLTVVDLFATQAILPSLARAYGVMPAAMGLAVNASTIGMAVAGLVVAFFSRRIDRRTGIVVSLALLTIPTALLAGAPDLATFAALRVVQGLFMSAAFTLTLAYLGEHCSAADAAGALAAYVTGNVASNLFGRLLSAAVADHLGLAVNFYVFALLNLAGAILVWFWLGRSRAMLAAGRRRPRPWRPGRVHLRNAPLRRGFAIGFLILFAFIGTFTFVNFVLVRESLGVSPMALGLVYFVFLPAIFTTPLAGRIARRFGTRPTFWGAPGRRGRRPAAPAHAEPAAGAARPRRWWGSAPSSHRPSPPASSAARPPPTAARPAASTSPATSWAGWSARPSWARCSTGWAGRPASPGSAWRWRWRYGSPAG